MGSKRSPHHASHLKAWINKFVLNKVSAQRLGQGGFKGPMSKLFSFYFSLWFLTISRESVAMVVKKVELTELGEQGPQGAALV